MTYNFTWRPTKTAAVKAVRAFIECDTFVWFWRFFNGEASEKQRKCIKSFSAL